MILQIHSKKSDAYFAKISHLKKPELCNKMY